jgi:hypothetical protein
MKVAVIGYPRTGSTLASMLLCEAYNLEYLGELVRGYYSDSDKSLAFTKLDTVDNICVKFFPGHIKNHISEISWGLFDIIITTGRKSIVDAYISLEFALSTNHWIKTKGDSWATNILSVDASTERIQKWVEVYLASLNTIITKIEAIYKKPILNFTYEELLKTAPAMKSVIPDQTTNKLTRFGIIPADINYKEQCINYVEVENKFKELGLI